jgi:LacI family transcriptional regulator
VIAWINSFPERKPWGGQIPFISMYQGAANRAQQLGYKLEEFWLREPGMTGRKLSRILYQRGIECLILAPIPRAGGHLTMDWEKFSTVTICEAMAFPRLHRVTCHHLHAAREAIRQLYRQGYRRIGLCLSVDSNLRNDHSPLESLAYHQLRISQKQWVKPLVQTGFSEKALFRWLKNERPDVILSHYTWLQEILTKAGYRVPEDIALALSDLENAKPNTAGINQRYATIGETASDLVVGQHYRNEKGVPALPHTIMIDGYWVDGSTAPQKHCREYSIGTSSMP